MFNIPALLGKPEQKEFEPAHAAPPASDQMAPPPAYEGVPAERVEIMASPSPLLSRLKITLRIGEREQDFWLDVAAVFRMIYETGELSHGSLDSRFAEASTERRQGEAPTLKEVNAVEHGCFNQAHFRGDKRLKEAGSCGVYVPIGALLTTLGRTV